MLWIEAALAFAITMMILSTVVTVIIETGHRLFRVREKYLQALMQRLHSDVLIPLLPASEQRNADPFVHEMTTSAFVANPRTALDRIINSRYLTKLPKREFMRRLGAMPEGLALYQEHSAKRNELASLLEYITTRFDEIGNGASDYFKRRAALYSIIIGILLAFMLNINTLHLFETFLGAKDLRTVLVEKADKLEQLIQAQPDSEQLNAVTQSLRELQRNQFPIGWQQSPWLTIRGTDNPVLSAICWLLSVLLSGILIGLGGPFWFDTYRKLGVLAELHQWRAIELKGVNQDSPDREEWLALFEQTIKANQLRTQS